MKRDSGVDAAVDDALVTYKRGDVVQAEITIDSLLAKHPDIYSVHYGKGVIEAMKDNYLESITHFDNCLKIFPYHVDSWFNKALSHQRMFDLPNTILSIQKVAEYGHQGDHFVKHADNLLRDLEKITMENKGVTLNRYLEKMADFKTACNHMQNEDYEQAIAGYEQVISTVKDHVQSYGNLALCYAGLGQKDKALELLDKAIAIDPGYEPAKINKKAISRMEEGQKLSDLDLHMESLEYYKEKALR
ncbi:MAG: tetratricopeptide repeat protein [Desulfobulbaceae bacterium]|nr:tetratricopeptide repeat protein [Desulfobulbaceae bacterium]